MKQILKVAGVLFTAAQFSSAQPVPGQPVPAPSAAPPAPAPVSPGDGPRIRFGPTTFDFGKVKSTEPVRHEYFLTNTGNAVLEIMDVRPGCPGCTTALPWDRTIQPGQTGKIPIQFNPLTFSGPVAKSVNVTCNDPTQAHVTLHFQATVWRPIDVQPPFLYFTSVEGETNEVKVVRITNHLEEPLTLDPPQCSHPSFKTEIKTVQPGKEFELRVSYTGPASNATAQAHITIKTSSTNLPTINITAQAMIQAALAIMPLQITLPTGPLTTGFRHSQVIRYNGNQPIKLSEATVNAEGVTVQITEPQPGKFFVLIITFPPNFQSRPAEPLELTVHTSHPKHSVIKLPIVPTATPAPGPGQAQPLSGASK